MTSMIAASVELLPQPVGPVTRTTPFFNSTISRNCCGKLKSSKRGGRVGITRMTIAWVPRCLKMLTRKRQRPGRLNEISAEPNLSRLHVAMNEVDQLARAQMAASQSSGDQTLAPVLFAGWIHRFRNTIGIEHQHLARLDRRVIFVVTRIAKHSQRHAAAFFK